MVYDGSLYHALIDLDAAVQSRGPTHPGPFMAYQRVKPFIDLGECLDPGPHSLCDGLVSFKVQVRGKCERGDGRFRPL